MYNQQKAIYYNKLIESSQGDLNLLYKFVKLKKVDRDRLPLIMLYNGEEKTGINRIDYLSLSPESNFVHSNIDFSFDQNDFIEQIAKIYRTCYNDSHEYLWKDYINWIDVDKTKKFINELNDSKDPGPLLINTQFLKFNVETTAPVITNLINSMMMTGYVPESWKTSFIVPIPKKGDKKQINNYRGIALQSNFSKILDKLITELLYLHLEAIIPRQQHGFIKNKSTVSNLIEAHHFISQNIQDHQVDAIYFDFSKAFDQIDHAILAKKLAKLAVPINLYNLIINFVVNRKYIIKVDNIIYQNNFVTKSGVPQGSHCGPVLFLIYCADLQSRLANISLEFIQYADDVKFLKKVTSEYDKFILQRGIDTLNNRAIENRLKLNPSKTVHISYTRKRKLPFETIYYIGENGITREDHIKDLGITFQSNMYEI